MVGSNSPLPCRTAGGWADQNPFDQKTSRRAERRTRQGNVSCGSKSVRFVSAELPNELFTYGLRRKQRLCGLKCVFLVVSVGGRRLSLVSACRRNDSVHPQIFHHLSVVLPVVPQSQIRDFQPCQWF